MRKIAQFDHNENQNSDGAGCSLSDSEMLDRKHRWNALFQRETKRVFGTDDGSVRLLFRRSPEVEGLLRSLVELERQCCSSVDFVLSSSPDQLRLEIRGPWQSTPWKALLEQGAASIRGFVRDRYGRTAKAMAASDHAPLAGCGPDALGQNGCGAGNYAADDLAELPLFLPSASLSCGNPVSVAGLAEGETVLDLGSGAGLDLILSSRRVGPAGQVYGLDMTGEMIQLAQANLREAGVTNARLINGEIERIPLPPASVDVIVSNCVINLSPEKRLVFSEMFRVLKPGGRIALADVVAEDEGVVSALTDEDAWTACLAGALSRPAYRAELDRAGFCDSSLGQNHAVAPGFASVIVRACKPPASPRNPDRPEPVRPSF